MSETKVVHINKKDYTVYIGRGSIWGNPFVIGEDGDREDVIRKYEEHIRDRPFLMDRLPELEGQVLGCFCKPEACHGDVLIKLLKESKDAQ